jgi:serine protease Do
MKKIRVLLIISFLVLSILSFWPQLSTQGSTVPMTTTTQNTTTSLTPTTTFPFTTTATISSNGIDYFDLDDLIEQIYQSIRQDIYNQIYEELFSMISEEMYEAIYAQVTNRLEELIAQGVIPVTVDHFQDQIHAVVEIAQDSVFGITTYLGTEAKSLGSSVVYRFNPNTNTYFIITNHHVIDKGDNFKIVFENGSSVVATLLGVDELADIAILSFSGVGLSQTIQVSQLAANDSTAPGSILLAVGNPRGYNFYGSVTLGVVSGINRNVDGDFYVAYIQHDASINSGNSGGPIYNLDGEVIGINVSKYVADDIEGMGFSIPISLVKRIIERIEANTMPSTTLKSNVGTLLSIRPLLNNEGKIVLNSLVVSPSLTLTNATISIPSLVQDGMLIQTISSSSSFDSTALRVGDLIVAVNGQSFIGAQGFYRYLYDNFAKGDSVSITYYTFNSTLLNYSATTQTIQVTLK